MKALFDMNKARTLMKDRDIDVLIASSPENFYYVAGYAGMAYFGPHGVRVPGLATAVVPRSQDQEPAAIVLDWEAEKVRKRTWIKDLRIFETWIYFEREGVEPSHIVSKPEQFDPVEVISQTLKEKKLEEGKLGVELDFFNFHYYERFRKALPKAELVDASGLFMEMRSIKTPTEIDRFRKGVKITEKGIIAAVEVAKEGVTEREIARRFRVVVADSDCWGMNTLMLGGGARTGSPNFPFHESSTYALKKGDFLRFDCGVNFEGALTDVSRTYVIGKPSEKQRKLYNTLLRAQRKIVQAMKPGVKFSELFKIGLETVREGGFPQYTRGHFGHSISLGPFEESPLLSPKENRALGPGMVLCVELPFYIVDFGGINIEDMVLITEDGREELTTLSRELSLG